MISNECPEARKECRKAGEEVSPQETDWMLVADNTEVKRSGGYDM